MDEKLYEEYIERICIGIEDALLPEGVATLQAGKEITPALSAAGLKYSSLRTELNKYRNRARAEGIIK